MGNCWTFGPVTRRGLWLFNYFLLHGSWLHCSTDNRTFGRILRLPDRPLPSFTASTSSMVPAPSDNVPCVLGFSPFSRSHPFGSWNRVGSDCRTRCKKRTSRKLSNCGAIRPSYDQTMGILSIKRLRMPTNTISWSSTVK